MAGDLRPHPPHRCWRRPAALVGRFGVGLLAETSCASGRGRRRREVARCRQHQATGLEEHRRKNGRRDRRKTSGALAGGAWQRCTAGFHRRPPSCAPCLGLGRCCSGLDFGGQRRSSCSGARRSESSGMVRRCSVASVRCAAASGWSYAVAGLVTPKRVAGAPRRPHPRRPGCWGHRRRHARIAQGSRLCAPLVWSMGANVASAGVPRPRRRWESPKLEPMGAAPGHPYAAPAAGYGRILLPA